MQFDQFEFDIGDIEKCHVSKNILGPMSFIGRNLVAMGERE